MAPQTRAITAKLSSGSLNLSPSSSSLQGSHGSSFSRAPTSLSCSASKSPSPEWPTTRLRYSDVARADYKATKASTPLVHAAPATATSQATDSPLRSRQNQSSLVSAKPEGAKATPATPTTRTKTVLPLSLAPLPTHVSGNGVWGPVNDELWELARWEFRQATAWMTKPTREMTRSGMLVEDSEGLPSGKADGEKGCRWGVIGEGVVKGRGLVFRVDKT